MASHLCRVFTNRFERGIAAHGIPQVSVPLAVLVQLPLNRAPATRNLTRRASKNFPSPGTVHSDWSGDR